MTLSESIAALVNYGMETGLTPACEKIYTTNLLLDIFHEDDYEEPSQIPSLSLEEILKERLQTAERIKHDVEAWLNTIPQRMQRIIRYKIFEELTWSEVAVRMGRKATADGVRMEYIRFMEEK